MNRFLFTLLAVVTLCTSSFGQRPIGTNPYVDTPVIIAAPNACGLGMTPDPVCLDQALKTFDFDSTAHLKAAARSWNVAADNYATDSAALEDVYHAGIAACNGDQACMLGVTNAFAADLQVAYNTFSAAETAIWATFEGQIDAARLAYKTAVEACCVDINTINPVTQSPTLGACGVILADSVQCPGGGPVDVACVSACRDTFYADLAVWCNTLNAQVNAAYVNLINAQKTATQDLVDAMNSATTQAEADAAIDAYNVTFNQIWKDFHEIYGDLSATAYRKQDRLFAEYLECTSLCCID